MLKFAALKELPQAVDSSPFMCEPTSIPLKCYLTILATSGILLAPPIISTELSWSFVIPAFYTASSRCLCRFLNTLKPSTTYLVMRRFKSIPSIMPST